MAVHWVVCLDLPREDDVLLFGGNLEGEVMELPAKHAGQDLNEARVGLHEVVVYQPSAMHPHLQENKMSASYILTTTRVRWQWIPHV